MVKICLSELLIWNLNRNFSWHWLKAYALTTASKFFPNFFRYFDKIILPIVLRGRLPRRGTLVFAPFEGASWGLPFYGRRLTNQSSVFCHSLAKISATCLICENSVSALELGKKLSWFKGWPRAFLFDQLFPLQCLRKTLKGIYSFHPLDRFGSFFVFWRKDVFKGLIMTCYKGLCTNNTAVCKVSGSVFELFDRTCLKRLISFYFLRF